MIQSASPRLFPKATARSRRRHKLSHTGAGNTRTAIIADEIFSLAFLLLSRLSRHPLSLKASYHQGLRTRSCLSKPERSSTPRHLQLLETESHIRPAWWGRHPDWNRAVSRSRGPLSNPTKALGSPFLFQETCGVFLLAK